MPCPTLGLPCSFPFSWCGCVAILHHIYGTFIYFLHFSYFSSSSRLVQYSLSSPILFLYLQILAHASQSSLQRLLPGADNSTTPHVWLQASHPLAVPCLSLLRSFLPGRIEDIYDHDPFAFMYFGRGEIRRWN